MEAELRRRELELATFSSALVTAQEEAAEHARMLSTGPYAENGVDVWWRGLQSGRGGSARSVSRRFCAATVLICNTLIPVTQER